MGLIADTSQQDPDAFCFSDVALKNSNQALEWAILNNHRVPGLKIFAHSNQSILVHALVNDCNYSVVNTRRNIAEANNVVHSAREGHPVRITLEVEVCENISGKQRLDDVV